MQILNVMTKIVISILDLIGSQCSGRLIWDNTGAMKSLCLSLKSGKCRITKTYVQ